MHHLQACYKNFRTSAKNSRYGVNFRTTFKISGISRQRPGLITLNCCKGFSQDGDQPAPANRKSLPIRPLKNDCEKNWQPRRSRLEVFRKSCTVTETSYQHLYLGCNNINLALSWCGYKFRRKIHEATRQFGQRSEMSSVFIPAAGQPGYVPGCQTILDFALLRDKETVVITHKRAILQSNHYHNQWKQEAQLMLTNRRDAFRGQSRSPNIVPLHMLGILSSCL